MKLVIKSQFKNFGGGYPVDFNLLLIYRDLALKMGGLGTQIGSNGEKRTKTSPIGK